MHFRLLHYRNPFPQWSLAYRLANELLMASMWYWIMFHFYFEHVSFFTFSQLAIASIVILNFADLYRTIKNIIAKVYILLKVPNEEVVF